MKVLETSQMATVKANGWCPRINTVWEAICTILDPEVIASIA